jgi:hypothetical protein
MKLIRTLTCLAAGLGLSSHASAQTTLFNQNFDGLGATSPITASGSNVNGSLGSGTGQFNYRVGDQQTLSIADKGSSNYALRLTDNNTTANDSTISRNFTGVSTTGTGANIITGSFDYTPLTLGSGTRGDLVFSIATTGSTTPSGGTSAVQLTFSGGTGITYLNGTNAVIAVPTLTVGTAYRININADFGSDTQDTWGFSITNLSNSTELLSLTGLLTRAANITPGAIFLAAGLNPGRISPDAHVELDNINFVSTSAIPEPGTYGLLLGTGALLMVGMRRRR